MTPVVAFIVAVAENGVIGRDGALPWRIPSETARVSARITLDKPVIMGRKTFASLRKPLGQARQYRADPASRFRAARGHRGRELEQALKVARDCARRAAPRRSW